MKKILVLADPLEGPQPALQEAIALGAQIDAVVHALLFCHASTEGLELRGDANQVKTGLLERTELKWLEQQQRIEGAAHCEHEIVWEKDIQPWVLQHCQSHAYEFLVRSHYPASSDHYDPADWILVRDAGVPVVNVVAADEIATSFKGEAVLATVDLASNDPEKQRLNRELLSLAHTFATAQGCDLHCCYAIEIPALVKDFDLVDVPATVHRLEREARTNFIGFAEDYGIDREHLHIREGKPHQVVQNFARKLKARQVLVGSIGRRGLSARLLGNCAEKLLKAAICDVVVI